MFDLTSPSEMAALARWSGLDLSPELAGAQASFARQPHRAAKERMGELVERFSGYLLDPMFAELTRAAGTSGLPVDSPDSAQIR